MRYILLMLLINICLFANTINVAKKLFDDKKYMDALIIFNDYQNSPISQYYLGKAYLFGNGVSVDYKKAFEHTKRSADLEYPDGINLLGMLYRDGKGVDKNQFTALKYFKQAAEMGSTNAMYSLSNAYTIGEFLKQDLDKAMYWGKEIIKKNDPRGYWVIADLYKNYLHDNEKALENYLLLEKSSFNIDDFNIIYEEIADLYRWNKEFDKAYSYYKKAIKNDNTYAINKFYYMVNNGYKKDELMNEAINYLKKAIDLGNKAAAFNLYYEYSSNQKDYKKTIELTQKLYKNGNVEMGCYLAQAYDGLYFKNVTDLDKSYTIATNIIKDNNLSKDTSTCYNILSIFYKTGHYLAKDIQKSIELKKLVFNEVYNKKNSIYSASIAELFLEELRDYANAQKWYQITYEITKDKSYLTKLDEFKKSLPNYKDKDLSKVQQKVYPIIDNFTKKEQVAAVLETERYYFLAIDQKYVNMYDKKTLALIKIFRGWIGDSMDGAVNQMAYDEEKKLLYCSGINSSVDFSKNDLIKVFDIKTGKIVNTINNKNAMKSIYLNISEDGKYLVSINNNTLLNIINTKNNEIQHYNFSNIANFTKANIIQKDNDYFINVLGNDNYLYTFSVNEKRQVSKEKFIYQTQFKTFNENHVKAILDNQQNQIFKIENISVKNNQLFIKTSEVNFIKNFNLINLTLSNTDEEIDVKSNSKSNITIKYKNQNISVEIYKNKQLLSNIEFYNTSVLKHKIIDDKYIILTTSDLTAMFIFNIQGKPIAKLKGFNSIQTNIFYQNGQLITYGNDNIIHLWNINNLDELNKIKESYDEEILHGFNKTMGGNILDILDEPDEDLVNISKLQSKQNNLPYVLTPKQFKSFFKMFLLKKEEIYPLASLLFKDNDWIIYNNKGYFTSSINGKNLIKYHLNQGLKKEAKIINNEQIFEKFYRPDIIKKLLANETITDSLDIQQVLQNINPPSVNILKNKLIDDKNLELTYKVCDNGSGISNTSILLNNIQRNIAASRGFSIEKKESSEKCTTYKNIITLQAGKNSIAIKSFDKNKIISQTSDIVEVLSKYKAPTKSNLHFLSVAVSNYKDSSLQLKYSISDAEAVKNKIQHHSKELFENIYTYDLHDENVTLKNLDKIFDKISKNIFLNDVFILYIAGHGVTNIKNGLYYFLPYDITNTSSDGLINSAISINDIKYQLGKIEANKSLILLDTCASGGAIETFASRGIEQRMALERLSYATGRNFITASSKNQVAIEGYQNHGVFTYSVLESFNKAYFGNDKILTVTSLASFIEKTVPKITREKFQYEQFPQKYLNGNDFPIGIKSN